MDEKQDTQLPQQQAGRYEFVGGPEAIRKMLNDYYIRHPEISWSDLLEKQASRTTGEIKTTLFPEATLRAVQAILHLHGASLEVFREEERPYCLIHVPEGSHRKRVERLAYHERYITTLPDGFAIFQLVDQEGWSSIRFPLEEANR